MKIIFIGNYKGGVGKTTSTLFLGKHLSNNHGKTLLLDLDSQSSLSEMCIKKVPDITDLQELDDNRTLNYIFDLEIENIKKGYNLDLKFDYDDLVYSYKDDLDFIPTKIDYKERLGLDELSMNMETDIRYFSILAKLIKNFEDTYEYLIIDCPPSSNVITQSAFLASDFYMIPTIVDAVSTNGIIHYIATINHTYSKYCIKHDDAYLYKHYFSKKPELLGIFYTLIRGQVKYDADKQRLTDNLAPSTYIFENFTNNFVDIARAVTDDTVESLPSNTDTYNLITDEMIDRINTFS